ncbi:hypothetical protein D3C76_1167400 [compost metagenome]
MRGRTVAGGRRVWFVEQVAPVGALLHLLAGGRVDQRLGAVPAAAERLVQVDQAADRSAAVGQVGILLGDQRALGVEYALEVRVAFAVLGVGQVQRALGGLRRLAEDVVAFEGLDQADGGVVRLARCLSHAILVEDYQLLQAGVLHPHVVPDPAVVEDVPAQAGAADQVEGVRGAVQRAGGPDDAAEQAQGGIEIGFGDADQCRLGGHLEFRGAYVGPAQQQVGGHVLQYRAIDQRDQPLVGAQLG